MFELILSLPWPCQAPVQSQWIWGRSGHLVGCDWSLQASSSSKGPDPHWLHRDADGHLHHHDDDGGGHLLHDEAPQPPPHWHLEQNASTVASASVTKDNVRTTMNNVHWVSHTPGLMIEIWGLKIENYTIPEFDCQAPHKAALAARLTRRLYADACSDNIWYRINISLVIHDILGKLCLVDIC